MHNSRAASQSMPKNDRTPWEPTRASARRLQRGWQQHCCTAQWRHPHGKALITAALCQPLTSPARMPLTAVKSQRERRNSLVVTARNPQLIGLIQKPLKRWVKRGAVSLVGRGAHLQRNAQDERPSHAAGLSSSTGTAPLRCRRSEHAWQELPCSLHSPNPPAGYCGPHDGIARQQDEQQDDDACRTVQGERQARQLCSMV